MYLVLLQCIYHAALIEMPAQLYQIAAWVYT